MHADVLRTTASGVSLSNLYGQVQKDSQENTLNANVPRKQSKKYGLDLGQNVSYTFV